MTMSLAPGLAIFTSIALAGCRGDQHAPSPTPTATSFSPEASARQLERLTKVDDPASLGVGRAVDLPVMPTLSDATFDLSEAVKVNRCVVISITSFGCPVSQKYAPRFAALSREFAKRGVKFVELDPIPTDTPFDLKRQARTNDYRGEIIMDPEAKATIALGARTTTDIFVFDSQGVMRYRGAFDDQFGVGETLEQPSREFLRPAIEAVLAGHAPEYPATWAAGCLLDLPEATRESPADTPLTYYANIAPIIARSCVTCHRTGGSAPFSMTSVAAIEGRASMIEAMVRERIMPPSHGVATAGEGPWRTIPTLSEPDRETFLTWLRSGRALGLPDDEPKLDESTAALSHPIGWAIGSPDVLLMTPSMRLEVDGPLQHSRSVLPIRLDEAREVRAIEFKPMKPGSIQLTLAWLIPPGVTAPEGNILPGEESGIQFFGAYGAGHQPIEFPQGASRTIQPGSSLLVDTYSRPMGRLITVSQRIAMVFERTESRTNNRTNVSGHVLMASTPDVVIPPGEPSTEVTASLVLTKDVRLVALTPHMRARGHSMTIDAALPNGSIKRLLTCPTYDWRWQIRYAYATPLDLPKGTRLVATGVFENSRNNPSNPDASATVRQGAGPGDEALLVGLEWMELTETPHDK
ncbi:MAG: redoxin domain-containing protein [Phycisphaerales bacterium]